ncbi:MAG: phytoene/squalene synthase family protein [Flavobacteriaceae bacterium]
MSSHPSTVAAGLRESDRDRYLAAILAPPAIQGHLSALYAFHNEIARIGDLVSDVLPGEIRLQWWRDAIAGSGHGDVRANPLAAALLDAIAAGAMHGPDLQRLIDARADDLYGEAFADMAALETRLRRLSGGLFRIALGVAAQGGSLRDDAYALADEAGIAEGIVGTLRNIGFDASKGRVLLPADLMARHGVDPARLLSGETGAGFPALVGAMLDVAESRLSALRAASPLPAGERIALLPAALVAPRIAMLRRATPDIRATPADMSPLRAFWRLWLARRTGRF